MYFSAIFPLKFGDMGKTPYLCCPFYKRLLFRGVAQLASASGLGPEGPVFESQYPDTTRATVLAAFVFMPFSGRVMRRSANDA